MPETGQIQIDFQEIETKAPVQKNLRLIHAPIFLLDTLCIIMSLLEKRESSAKLDDTIPLYCNIEGHEKKETFVVCFLSTYRRIYLLLFDCTPVKH